MLDGPIVDFEPISKQLTDLGDLAENLSHQSEKIIADAISDANKKLNQALTELKTEIAELKTEQKRAEYVASDNLPFEVLHIDNIQGTNVVAVHYNNTTFPINVGDYLASWKLVEADFSGQKAEFVNPKQQHLVVDLNRIDVAMRGEE